MHVCTYVCVSVYVCVCVGVFVLLSFMFFMENNYHYVLNKSLKVCQKLSIASRWHIIGMNNAGLS